MKPRVAIYYYVLPTTGMRNDGAPLFCNYNLRKILNGCKTMEETRKNMGNEHENVRHLWPHGDTSKFGLYDLHLLVDHGEDVLNVPLDFQYPHPNAYWTSDTHLGYDYRLETAKKFDFVFCAQKRAMQEFIRDGVDPKKVFWLPHAVEPDCYKPYPIIEKYDWSFIGYMNCPERVELLDRFCREFPKWYIGWRQPEWPGYNVLDDVARKFSQAKIIPNRTIKDDISMRVFEALATKRFLLNNALPTLPELLEPGKHLVTYQSVDEAVSLAKEFLADDDRRNAIAQAGYEEVLAKHTYRHRVETILKTCLDYSEKGETVCLSA